VIVQNISPLIYKIQLADGSFTIVHIIRIKKTCGRNQRDDRFYPHVNKEDRG